MTVYPFEAPAAGDPDDVEEIMHSFGSTFLKRQTWG